MEWIDRRGDGWSRGGQLKSRREVEEYRNIVYLGCCAQCGTEFSITVKLLCTLP